MQKKAVDVTFLDPDGFNVGETEYGILSTLKWTEHSSVYCL